MCKPLFSFSIWIVPYHCEKSDVLPVLVKDLTRPVKPNFEPYFIDLILPL